MNIQNFISKAIAKWKIFLVLFVTLTFLAVIYNTFAEKYYKSSIRIYEIKENNFMNNASGNLLGMIGGSETMDNGWYGLKLLRSRDLLEDFIQSYGSNKILNKYYGEEVKNLSTETQTNIAYSIVSEDLQILPKQDGVTQINFIHKDKTVPAEFLDGLIKYIDDYVREKDIKDKTNFINNLELKISKQPNNMVDKALAKLYENNLQELLVIESSNEYVFGILDSPRFPYNHYRPNLIMLLVISLLISLALHSIYIFYKHGED